MQFRVTQTGVIPISELIDVVYVFRKLNRSELGLLELYISDLWNGFWLLNAFFG
jgi:hypothetical protein